MRDDVDFLFLVAWDVGVRDARSPERAVPRPLRRMRNRLEVADVRR